MSDLRRPARVLVVDDDEKNCAVVEAMLRPMGHEIQCVKDGETAIREANRHVPDIILMDIAMPGMNGYEAVRILRKSPLTALVPIVMISARHGVDSRLEALAAGSDDYLLKPVDIRELRLRVETLVRQKYRMDEIQESLRRMHSAMAAQMDNMREAGEVIKSLSDESVIRLVNAAESRDGETGSHIKRISRYVEAIAKAMGMPSPQAAMMGAAAQMHDIGKIGIKDSILRKRGVLYPDERLIMQEHTHIGANILKGSDLPIMQMAEVIARTHHEKWDGSGYPEGQAGLAIPIEGRITAIADVFDALASHRCYRLNGAYSTEEAFQMMTSQRGIHFDPDILDVFMAIRSEIVSIWQEYSDSSSSSSRS